MQAALLLRRIRTPQRRGLFALSRERAHTRGKRTTMPRRAQRAASRGALGTKTDDGCDRRQDKVPNALSASMASKRVGPPATVFQYWANSEIVLFRGKYVIARSSASQILPPS